MKSKNSDVYPMKRIIHANIREKIIYIFLIVVISITIGWLMNVPYSEEVFDFIILRGAWFFWNIWTYYSIILFMILFAILSYALFMAFKERIISKKSLLIVTFAFLILVLSMIGIIKLLYQHNPIQEIQFLYRKKVNQSVSIPSQPSINPSTSSKNNLTKGPLRILNVNSNTNPLLIIFFVISISFLLLILFYMKNTGVIISESKDINKIGFPEKEINTSKFEVRRIKTINLIDVSIDDILKCEDVRKSIILVYIRLCNMLREHNIDVPENITAREFENKVFSLLPFMPRDYFHQLTLLFEEAKYSDHKLTFIHKKKALDLLLNIRKSLVTLHENRNV
ncbi:MAG: DUF4129 domain-containing protein [Thermoproteales archaeon]|nr:DUF4129 domain-containing protein [Thermoproteales archaeon]